MLNISKEELLRLLDLDSIDERTFLTKVWPMTQFNPWPVGAKVMIKEIPNRDKLTVELSLEEL